MHDLANSLTKKAPYKGLGADSEEKHEPVSDINTVVADSLKALDPEWPIREADIISRQATPAHAAMGDDLHHRAGATAPGQRDAAARFLILSPQHHAVSKCCR